MAKSRLWTIHTVAVFGALAGVSQAQTPAYPGFEVASVKLNRTEVSNARIFIQTDRFDAIGVPLRGLIALAYGEAGPPPKVRPNDQIAGGPDWMNTELYDVVAKAGSDVPAGPAGVEPKLLMLRSLLEQRFKLVVHHENRDAPFYALVLARSDRKLGPQFQHSDVDCRALLAARGGSPTPPPTPGQRPLCRADTARGGTMIGGALTMADIVNTLSRLLNRVVTDRTGLSGSFDVDLQFSPEGVEGLAPSSLDQPVPFTDKPSLFTALQEQLGLKLESTEGPVDVLVIDRAERPDPD
jgi:uncharacterized protein (TIGR03435 family)